MALVSGSGSHPWAYQEVANIIRDRILSGSLKPGDRIFSELAAANEFNVSRSTVREAFRLLEESGFIERPSPKVMLVKEVTSTSASREFTRAMQRTDVTFAELFDALLVIEPALARLAAINGDKDGIERLQKNLAQQADHLDDYQEWFRLDQEFHVGIAEMSGNRALLAAREAFMNTARLGFGARGVPDQTTRGVHHHRLVLEEIIAADADGAFVMMQKHVRDAFRGWTKHGFDLSMTLSKWQRVITSSTPTVEPVSDSQLEAISGG